MLPLVILGFSLLLGNSVQIDLIGITVGHVYYFLEDVFPNQPGGFRILKTPRFLYVNYYIVQNLFFNININLILTNLFLPSRRNLFDPTEEDPGYNPLPEDRPGGFDWGAGAPPNPDRRADPNANGDGPEVNGNRREAQPNNNQ